MQSSWTEHVIDFNKTQEILASVRENGIALIDGLHAVENLATLAQEIGVPILHRDSNQIAGIITLQPKDTVQRETFKGYTRKEQYLHTDGTMVENPADVVVLMCQKEAPRGGESIFVDGKALYKKLAKDTPQLLPALFESAAATFGEAADRILQKPIFTKTDPKLISISFRYDRLVKFSPTIQKEFQRLLDTMNDLTISIKLRPTEGYVINNHRFIHGRKAFLGDRMIHRVQIHAHKPHAIPQGFDIDERQGYIT